MTETQRVAELVSGSACGRTQDPSSCELSSSLSGRFNAMESYRGLAAKP
jgi:hypothetical protein